MSGVRPILILLVLALSVLTCRAPAQQITVITNGLAPLDSLSEGTSPPSNAKNSEDDSIYRNEPDHVKIEFSADHRRVLNGDYQFLTGGTLAAVFTPTDENVLGPFLGFGAVQLAPWSEADQIARQPFYLQAGLVVRHYFTPAHVLLRPYVALNVDYFWMAWDYRTPVPVDGGTVSTDWIGGMESSAALGLSVRFHESVSLFGEISGGGVVLPDQTNAGIDNTFFGNFEYVGVKAGLSLWF